MTKSYNGDKFTHSQFLVFMNRVSALFTSGMCITFVQQPRHVAPLFKYSFSSFSNILSSWCQYEALKYVSFPTQILSKSCKVIPVMLMGKLVSSKVYPWYDYLMAMLVSMGVALFLLATKTNGVSHMSSTTGVGLVILFCYMWFDSFTSNWQSKLFNQYKMTPFQMMFGVNVFSSLLTLTSLLFGGTFLSSFNFFFSHFDFAVHSIVLSICSAVGQLFIYYTISQFGPLVFTLIVTTRQAVSILLSCLVYAHSLTTQALIGICVVFFSLLLRTFLQERNKYKTQKT